MSETTIKKYTNTRKKKKEHKALSRSPISSSSLEAATRKGPEERNGRKDRETTRRRDCVGKLRQQSAADLSLLAIGRSRRDDIDKPAKPLRKTTSLSTITKRSTRNNPINLF